MENTRICDSFADALSKSVLLGSARIAGNLSGPGDLVLDGEVQGDIAVDGLLVIGETGFVQGKVAAGNMILSGRVQGRITVKERIEIRASGRLKGNIACMKIAIAEGAFVDGEIHTHKGKSLEPDYFTEKRKDLQESKAFSERGGEKLPPGGSR